MTKKKVNVELKKEDVELELEDMVMVKGNVFKKITDLVDDDEILVFILGFDGVEARYLCSNSIKVKG